MKQRFSKLALIAVIVAPLAAGERGCSSTGATNPATLACMQRFINKGMVNQTTYEYYKQVCMQPSD